MTVHGSLHPLQFAYASNILKTVIKFVQPAKEITIVIIKEFVLIHS